MEENIQNWLDNTVRDSQIRWECAKAEAWDDPDGWGGVFAAFLQECDPVSGCGILLTGADSYGKQSAAMELLRLLSSDAYACEGVFLDGMELSTCGAQQAIVRLDALLDRFYDMQKGLCLILEGMEECPCRRELLHFLGQKLCEYRMYREEFTPLFLILIDDREQAIPASLRSSLRLYRMSLPDQSRRTAYLEEHARSLRNYLSLELFSRATEGASYMQLRDMISAAGYLVDSRDRALSDEELTAFLAGQMPVSAPENMTQKLYQSVRQLAEQLPQILKDISAGRVVSQGHDPVQLEQQPQVPLDQGKYLADKRQQIEQMPPRELAIELFGEEAVDRMRQMTDAQRQ